MSLLKQNILANFAGKGLIALVSMVFLPVYIGFLGIQAYGLVGFYLTLQSLFFIFDAGLSTTLNRELARLSALGGREREARDTVRTLEVVYFTIAGAVALAVFLLAPLISDHWINPGDFSGDTLRQIVIMMGVAIAFQFPYSLYSGGLMGLQRQVLLNGLDVAMAALRSGGAVLVLWLVSPTIGAFFAWQIAVSLLQTATTAFFLWRSMPRADARPRFSGEKMAEVFRFTLGISAINVLAIALTQMDKLVLSKILVLAAFGYYMLAASVSSALGLIAVPFFNGVFPRLSQLVIQGDDEGVKKLYHQGCQLVSVTVLPAAVILILFSREVLLAWTRDAGLAENAHVIVSLLVAGTMLNALMSMPYALQLANGWTKLALYQNVISVVLLVPAIVFLASNYGTTGAASVWVMLNAGYILIGLYLMHRRFLKGELKKWYLVDVGPPLAGALAVAGVARLYMPLPASAILLLAEISLLLLASVAAASLLTPYSRELIASEWGWVNRRAFKLRL